MATVVNRDIYKQIDRLNKRMENAVKQADKLQTQELVNKYEDVMRAAVPEQFLSRNKKGILIISKSKMAQTTITQDMLDRIEGLQSPGSFESDVLKATASETGQNVEDVTIEEMQKYLADKQTVEKAEDAKGKIHYSEEYSSIMQAKGSKTYKELAEVVRAYEAKENENKSADHRPKKVVTDYDSNHAKGLSKIRNGRCTSNRVR